MQSFYLKYIFEILYLLAPIVTSNSYPSGHMKPLGQHRPPESTPIEILNEFPTPKYFHEKYVKAGKPILFRGILEKGIQPAYNQWTDKFLREKFGDLLVDVEMGKKENRSNEMIQIKLSNFLRLYNKSDIYMVQDAPTVMAEYLNIPRSLQCGGFQNVLSAVVLWFSSGGTKSVLHTDSYDNFNCLLDGEKYLVMIDKKHSNEVESHHWNFDGSFSDVDPEKVDMYKFPNLRNIPWFEVHLKKGDCLYIPYQWYHHVDSKKGRNFAVNIWFGHLLSFNDTDCKGVDQEKLVARPVPEFSFSKEIIREDFLEFFDGIEEITMTVFEEVLRSNIDGKPLDDKEKDSVKEVFQVIDTNQDDILSHEEIFSFDMYKIKDLLPSRKFVSDGLYFDNNSQTEEEISGANDKESKTEDTDRENRNQDEELKKALDRFHQTNKLHDKDEL